MGAVRLPEYLADLKDGGDVALAVDLAALDAALDALAGATAAALAGKADAVHSHAAAAITSGVLAPARLGTGTANSATVLHGDGTWGAVPPGYSDAQADARIAAAVGVSVAAQGHTHDAATLTGTLADARLSSNVPLKGSANEFTANQVIRAGLALRLYRFDNALFADVYLDASNRVHITREVHIDGLLLLANPTLTAAGWTIRSSNGLPLTLINSVNNANHASAVVIVDTTGTAGVSPLQSWRTNAVEVSYVASDGAYVLGGRSSAAVDRDRAAVGAAAIDNTDATRKYRGLLYAYDTASRECVRWWADGAAGRVALGAPASAPADAHLGNGQVSCYLDEAGHKLHFRVKYSGGALKTGEVALT